MRKNGPPPQTVDGSGQPATRRKRPTEDELVVRLFGRLRGCEQPGATERAERIAQILQEKARDLFAESCRREELPKQLFGPNPPVDVGLRRSPNVVNELRRKLALAGLEYDQFARRALRDIRRHHRYDIVPTPHTPKEYRQLGLAFETAAKSVRTMFELPRETQASMPKRGRPLSGAMEFLLAWADRKALGTAALVKLLVQERVRPPGYDADDPDADTMSARWEGIIKAARLRRRGRSKVTK